MTDLYGRRPNDTVTVDQHVLRALARTAALQVPGVVRIGTQADSLTRWLGRDPLPEDIHITFMDEDLLVRVSLVIDATYNLQRLCTAVQQSIRRTLQDYVGVGVQAVNVQIVDIVYGDT